MTASYWSALLVLLPLLLPLGTAQYISCKSQLGGANSDGDSSLSRDEFSAFLASMTGGSIVDGLAAPAAITDAYSKHENAATQSVDITGANQGAPSYQQIAVESFCDDMFEALATVFEVSVPQNKCVGALQAADKNPGNSLISDNEFIPFVRAITSETFGAPSAFSGLPVRVQSAFTDFATDGEVRSSKGMGFLEQFCLRTALYVAIELQKVESEPDATPPTLPPQQRTSAPTKSPVVSVFTPSRVTEEQLKSCRSAMDQADSSGDLALDQAEYVNFLSRLSPYQLGGTTYASIHPLYVSNYETIQNDNNLIDIAGAALDLSPPSAQLKHFDSVCGETLDMIDLVQKLSPFPPATPSLPATPAPAPKATPAPVAKSTPAPVVKSTPAPVAMATPAPIRMPSPPTSTPAPSAPPIPENSTPGTPHPDSTQCTDLLLSVDSDKVLDKAEYAAFVHSLSGTGGSAPGFDTLPYLIRDNYEWIKIGEDAVVLDGLASNSDDGIAYGRYICDRTQTTLDLVSEQGSKSASTLLEQCSHSSRKADKNDDNSLDEQEFFSFIDDLSGLAWEGLQYGDLDEPLRKAFEENKVSGSNLVDISAAKLEVVPSPTSISALVSLCDQASDAIASSRKSDSFFQRCRIALAGANENDDDSLSKAEYVEFLYNLAGGESNGQRFKGLDDKLQLNYELLALRKGSVSISGISGETTLSEMKHIRWICATVESVIDSVPVSNEERKVNAFNSFITSNTAGLRRADLQFGFARTTLENSYKDFVQEQVPLVQLQARNLRSRRRLKVLGTNSDSIRLYRIDDTSCPNGVDAGASCQTVFGSFEITVDDEDNAEGLSQRYSDALQAAIDDGALQSQLTARARDFPIKVYGSSTPLRPSSQTPPDKNESGGSGNTALIVILVLLAVLLVAAGLWYYRHKKGSLADPMKGTDSFNTSTSDEPAAAEQKPSLEKRSVRRNPSRRRGFSPIKRFSPQKLSRNLTKSLSMKNMGGGGSTHLAMPLGEVAEEAPSSKEVRAPPRRFASGRLGRVRKSTRSLRRLSSENDDDVPSFSVDASEADTKQRASDAGSVASSSVGIFRTEETSAPSKASSSGSVVGGLGSSSVYSGDEGSIGTKSLEDIKSVDSRSFSADVSWMQKSAEWGPGYDYSLDGSGMSTAPHSPGQKSTVSSQHRRMARRPSRFPTRDNSSSAPKPHRRRGRRRSSIQSTLSMTTDSVASGLLKSPVRRSVSRTASDSRRLGRKTPERRRAPGRSASTVSNMTMDESLYLNEEDEAEEKEMRLAPEEEEERTRLDREEKERRARLDQEEAERRARMDRKEEERRARMAQEKGEKIAQLTQQEEKEGDGSNELSHISDHFADEAVDEMEQDDEELTLDGSISVDVTDAANTVPTSNLLQNDEADESDEDLTLRNEKEDGDPQSKSSEVHSVSEDEIEEASSDHEELPSDEEDRSAGSQSEEEVEDSITGGGHQDKEYRAKVEALLKESVPEELDNMDSILRDFEGKEDELIETLHNITQKSEDDGSEGLSVEEEEGEESSRYSDEDVLSEISSFPDDADGVEESSSAFDDESEDSGVSLSPESSTTVSDISGDSSSEDEDMTVESASLQSEDEDMTEESATVGSELEESIASDEDMTMDEESVSARIENDETSEVSASVESASLRTEDSDMSEESASVASESASEESASVESESHEEEAASYDEVTVSGDDYSSAEDSDSE